MRFFPIVTFGWEGGRDGSPFLPQRPRRTRRDLIRGHLQALGLAASTKVWRVEVWGKELTVYTRAQTPGGVNFYRGSFPFRPIWSPPSEPTRLVGHDPKHFGVRSDPHSAAQPSLKAAPTAYGPPWTSIAPQKTAQRQR